jgi:hypothetical protein
MAGLSHRILSIMLRQLKDEKEQHLRAESEAAQKQLESEEEDAKRKLASVHEHREELERKLEKERKELDSLRAAIDRESIEVQAEQQEFAIRKRLELMRGNDNDSVRERLRAEGYSESVIITALRMRTLDETVERDTALPARFTHWESDRPLEQRSEQREIYANAPQRGEQPSAQYDTNPSAELYREQQFAYQKNDAVQPRTAAELATSTITYAGKKL